MTFFGIIWVALALVCFINKDIRFSITFTLISMFFQCNKVFEFGTFGVGPQILGSILFIIRYIFYRRGKKFNHSKQKRGLYFLLIILFIIVLLSSYLNNAIGKNILVILQLLSYICCFICISKVSESIDKEYIYKTVRKITIFALIIGVIQILTTTNVIPRLTIISELFFNEKRGAVYYYHNNYLRITSTFMEPSYFAGFIVGAFYYILAQKDKIKNNTALLIAMGIEIIFTFSSTAYGTFLIIGIIYILFSNLKISNKVFLVSFFSIIFIIMYFGFYNVLDKVIFSKNSSGSATKRNNMNARALEAFKRAPMLGYGYKNFRASSMIYCMLAELGTIGITIYTLTIVKIIKPLIKFKNKIKEEENFIVLYGLLGAIVAQLVACPDLDLCTFWIWMYIYALYDISLKINKKKTGCDIYVKENYQKI